MSHKNWLEQIIGVMLIALILVGCASAEPVATPTSTPPTSTRTPIPPTPTPTPVPPTPTPESQSLQIGDTFTVDSYQVKLIRVEERPTVIVAMSDRIGSIDPTQEGNAWLVLDIEITNTGDAVSSLALLTSDAVVVEADDYESELFSVGTSVEDFMLGFINEQKLTKGFLVAGTSGRVFVIADASQNLLVSSEARTVIGDPVGPQWDLGKLAPEGTAQLSLLFEVPAGATELIWQFLGSTPVSLPQPQTASLPAERGPSMTLSMTVSELCQLVEGLKLECP